MCEIYSNEERHKTCACLFAYVVWQRKRDRDKKSREMTKKTPGVACGVNKVRKKENRRTHIDKIKRRNTKIFRPFLAKCKQTAMKKMKKKLRRKYNIHIQKCRSFGRWKQQQSSMCWNWNLPQKICCCCCSVFRWRSNSIPLFCKALVFFTYSILLLFTVCTLFLIFHFLLESESLTQWKTFGCNFARLCLCLRFNFAVTCSAPSTVS